MVLRYAALMALSLVLAVVGYFFFAIVIAIHAGLWLHDDKMYFEMAPACHVFGATGAAVGVLVAWMLWRVALATFVWPNHKGKGQTGVNDE
jgi:nucleoside recognition membrane protein YjiH